MNIQPPTLSNSFKSRQLFVTEKLTVVGNISSTGTMVVDTSDSNAALRVTQRGSGNVIEIEDDANPDSTPFVVNNLGQIISGATTAFNPTAGLQITSNSNSSPNASLIVQRCSNEGGNASLIIYRSAGTNTAKIGLTGANTSIGSLIFSGFDGSEFQQVGRITCQTDGSCGPGDMPGRLMFLTTADGESSVTERMRITSAGSVGIGTTAPNELLTVAGNISSTGDINTTGRILSGGVDLFDLFTSSELASGIQTLSYIPSSYELSISLGNTVSLSSLNTTLAVNSAKYEQTYTTVSLNSSLWTTGYAVASTLSANNVDTALKYLSTNNVVISSIEAKTITVNTLNVPVTVITVSGTRIFTDTDSNKVIHFNTTSAPVCAIFPSSLTNGFNVAIMNTGINSVVLSSNIPLRATGTTIIDQYGGAFIYKQDSDIFAVGRLY